jgi:hypothetical protein
MKTGTFGKNDVAFDGAARDETTGSETDERGRPGEPDTPSPADSPAAEPTSSEDPCVDGPELPDEVRALLTEIGRALQREGMYPANHPALEGSAAKLRGFLAPALDGRDEVSINVARDQLSVDGAATDPGNPLLAPLADRLHRHQISALSLRRAVGTEEISKLLAALNSDPVDVVTPLRDQAWRDIRITFFPYEKLRLDTEGTSDIPAGEQTNVWLAFAQAALDDDSIELEDSMDTARVVERISELCPDDAYCRRVAERLLAVEEAVARDSEKGSVVGSLTSDVVATLNPQAVGQLLEQAGGSSARRQLLSAASGSLSVEAVLKLMLEAGRFEERETPDAMWLVFSKLAQRSKRGDAGQQHQASGLVRNQVLELLTAWETDGFMPADYSAKLAAVARAESGTAAREDRSSRTAVGPLRVLQMATETQQLGEAIHRSFDLLVRADSLGSVLDVLDGADVDNPAARHLRELIVGPEILSSMLSGQTPDFALVDRILSAMGVRAGPAMLDAIAEVESRADRGRLFQRLVGLGPGIGHEVASRLGDARWYVRRNLLALLDELGSPDGFSAVPFLEDEHEAVRRAAIKLALKQPADRERAIEAALASDDARAVILGLVAAKDACPSGLAERVANLMLSEDHSQDLRLHAVRALASVSSEAALRALIRIARGERRWIFLRRSGPPTPLELEALAALRAHWADKPEAKKVLSRRGGVTS